MTITLEQLRLLSEKYREEKRNGTFFCFWCDCKKYNRQRTIDHIIAKCLGGHNGSTNIVTSCYDCNHERGLIVEFHCRIKQLKFKIDKNRIRGEKRNAAIYRIKERQEEIFHLQRKWKDIEIDKLGTSVSGEIDISLKGIEDVT